MKTPLRTVLITGGNSGIGYELAKLFAYDSHELILIAKNEEKLLEAAQHLRRYTTVRTLAIDLSSPEAAMHIYKQYQGEVDILINNAGFGLTGEFTKTDLATELDMIQVNISALVSLTKYFLADMKKKRRGKILNVSSMAGFQPGPGMSIYYATKAFVTSFSEALGHELRGSGVSVSTLCPGATATDFAKTAHATKTKLFQKTMSAEEVALIAYTGLNSGKRIIIPGAKNKAMSVLSRLTPNTLSMYITEKFNQK
jgi:short-subunit dehydrogenase